MRLNNKITGTCIWMCIALLMAGCNATKHVPEGDALYTGAKITIDKKGVKADLKKTTVEELIRPKPNASFLGVRFKLGIYNLAGKGNKGLNKILKKWGEKPVLLSQVSVEKNISIIENNLENMGYFNVQASGDTTIKGRKALASYTVTPYSQYTINGVQFLPDSGTLNRAINKTAGESLLKVGDPFSLATITNERLRIDAVLKEKGFFYFSAEHLLLEVDTTAGSNTVNLFLKVKPQVPGQAKEKYFINNVYIYSNYQLSASRADTTTGDTISFRGYNVIDGNKTFKPLVFDRVMRFSPEDIYSRKDHNVTLARLTNLGTFKFVKNRFETAPGNNRLNVFYYLTPQPKKSLSAEIGGLTKSNNVTGSEVTLKWRNRNTFKGAELFTASAYFGTEVQYSGQFSGYNTLRYGAEATLAYPRFVVPVIRLNTTGSFVPRTFIKLGYDVLKRQKLFTLNSFRGEFGYSWKQNIRTEHQLTPISINYIKPIDVSPEYTASIANKPLLQRAVTRQFIFGSNYNFNYNQLADKGENASGIYFNGLLDVSGNIAGLITGANVRKGDTSKLFELPFSQYVKTEGDFRYYKKMGKKTLANRIIVGVGVPIGNSSILPYVKQFFIGGNNSLRAFRSRSVGPGTYNGGQRINTAQLFPDLTGDLKLELNSELRVPLGGFFSTAAFVDAGNIWLFNTDPNQPGGKLSKDFLSQLAVGAGIGLRIDVTILLLRLDVAIPLRLPYQPQGQRWVIDQINPGSSDWRKQNIVFNLAIGYPF